MSTNKPHHFGFGHSHAHSNGVPVSKVCVESQPCNGARCSLGRVVLYGLQNVQVDEGLPLMTAKSNTNQLG